MSSYASHTIVKNGMPFIGKVLRQVAPFMDKMFVAVSHHSTDGTINEVMKFIGENPGKVEFIEEWETNPAKLTNLRNFQVERTKQDWILFLDDDDYWPQDQLKDCLNRLELDEETLSFSVNPYQLTSPKTYDESWLGKKFFAKFLRNKGLKYIGDWPDDWPCDEKGERLYWKTHPKADILPYYFYHLALLKPNSFRNEEWAKKYKYKVGRSAKLDSPLDI